MKPQLKSLKPYLAMALKGGATDAVVIPPSQVVTAPWVRMKCQFGCAGFGRTLCCPPRTPTPEETRKVLDSYETALLVHLHWVKDYGRVAAFNEVIVDLERTLFLDGFYKAFAMGSGPCSRCGECDPAGQCRHSERARPSMEACGIDVYATARSVGLPIRVVKTHAQGRDMYGLVLVE
jgi:predicted metal-binding protein